MIEQHNLEHDFPEYAEKVKQLMASDAQFRATNRQYNQLDSDIISLEARGVPSSDETFNRMKYERAHLKDWLFQRLQS